MSLNDVLLILTVVIGWAPLSDLSFITLPAVNNKPRMR